MLFAGLSNPPKLSRSLEIPEIQLVKRSRFLFFFIEEAVRLDIAALLRGNAESVSIPQLVAFTVLTRSKQEVSLSEFRFLSRLPSRKWVSIAEIADSDRSNVSVESLARRGFVVCDGSDPKWIALRRHEELLRSQQWHPQAAFYHFSSHVSPTGSSDLEAIEKEATEIASNYVKRYGPPPSHFHTVCSKRAVELPIEEPASPLYNILRQRRTIRAFDTSRAMKVKDLAILLRYVFGCHGVTRLNDDVTLLNKTSPSGGSLHPIEAYPLVINAEGLATGLYHYNLRNHSLELLRELERDDAENLGVEFCNGQLFAASAHVLVLLTARFLRNQWKYRRNSRTYGVMLMDAGHLSQTFYLVATELGLGTFYTGAINGPKIEKSLRLDGLEEGALGVCGCGIKIDDSTSDLGLDRQRFKPRETIP